MVAPSFWNRFRMIERWEIVDVPGSGAAGKFFRNDFQIYCFKAPGMVSAITLLPEKLRKLQCFPVIINSRRDVNEQMIGRSIWYREIAAFVVALDGETGRVLIRPELHKSFPPEPWDEGIPGEEVTGPGDVWEDLLSPKIYWHRKED